MIRILALIAAGALLASCEDMATAKARNERLLPDGCRIIDMDYGDLRAAVVCDGRKTTTSLRSWDEIIQQPIVDAKGNVTMMQQIYHHASLSALIE